MMTIINAILEYQFLQKALIACLLSSVVCGIIGVIIIEKKLVMMCGGIAHTSYGGVGLGYLLGFEPIAGAFAFAVFAAFGIGFIKRKGSEKSDVLSGLFWSFGMALGVIFISLMPKYPPDITSYLFGSILSVTSSEIILMIILTIAVLLIFITFYHDWKAYLFDEEFASVAGVSATFLEYLLLILVAMAVVVLIRVVGIILILALLLAPAATAGMLCFNLRKRMVLSVILGWLCCIVGLWISYVADVASGAVIVVVSIFMYAVTFSISKMRGRTGRDKKSLQGS